MTHEKYALHHPGYDRKTYPEIISAKGAFLTSSDERVFFDAGLSTGSQVLGHADPNVVAAISKQISKGSVYLNNNPHIHSLCEELIELLPRPQKNFVFCNSGSEATQRALRLARAATGRDRIAYFQGGWHGMNEWTLVEDGGRFGDSKKSYVDGIPETILHHSLILPYNVDEAFNVLEENSNSLAAVIVEPLQGSNPQDNIIPFLKKLQSYCHENGTLLIFDEIITGFRLGLGGASKKWDLEPDIITYGKILGGGLPIGLVTCTDDVAGSTFYDESKRILTGGTFSANPLIAVTSLAVIQALKKQNYDRIDDLGVLMRSILNRSFKNKNIPYSVIGVGSVSRLAFTDQPFQNRSERDALEASQEIQNLFRKLLLDQDVLWPTNGIIFSGFCHTKELIESLCEKVINAASSTIAHKD